MKIVLKLDEIDEAHHDAVGGKAMALSRVARTELVVSRAVCVSAEVYDWFVEATGLRSRIVMEYDRKSFDQMR